MAATTWDEAAYEAVRARAAGSNLDPVTLLATDYLNHFNEIVMLLELAADMPDMLEEVKAWRPVGYVEHFRGSGIADRDIAIEAYPYVPPDYKEPFEETVRLIDELIGVAVERLEDAVGKNDPALIREIATRQSRNIQRLTEAAAAIIHGSAAPLAQADIDRIMEP